jgi:5-methylcytosine-specific restriction endonuclease McrA
MKEYYKKENLEKVVKESFSYAEVLRKIGLADVGSNFNTLKKYITIHNLDTSHFTGKLWNKGKTESDDPRVSVVPIEKIFTNEVGIRTPNLKDKLFKLGYKEKKCEICGCGENWQGKHLTLELHHIDGNHYNNSLENLQILCPNCHSQTDSYRKRVRIRKKKPEYKAIDKPKHICLYCGKEFNGKKNRKYCSSECSEKAHNSVLFTKNEIEELMKRHNTLTSMAKEKNVSRTTIKNYLIKYGLVKT